VSRAALPLAVLLLAVGAADGTRSVAYPAPSRETLGLAAFATLPLQLSAGPDGATISSTNTSSSATLSALPGGVVEASSNNTRLANPGSQAVRARLVFQSASASASRCLVCEMQIRLGATVTSEFNVTNGVAPAAGTAGALVTIPAGGTASILAGAKATLPQQNAVVSYWLEILPASGTSPVADYVLMSMTFVV